MNENGVGPSLEVRLTKRIHTNLTLDVALSVGTEIGVLFGASGAGKTTLLRLIAGLETPDDGVVRLGASTLFNASPRINQPLHRRRIGMIFQDDLLFPHLNVAANIGFGLKGEPRDRREARLSEVAKLCGVEHLLGRHPSTLSGGERQRVGLARALAPRPRLLLCDEPVSALDLSNRHVLLERLRAVQRTEQIPVLYVTHSPAEAIALGSRLFLIEHGRILTQGLPLDVLTSARSGPPLPLEGVRNLIPAQVEEHAPGRGATSLRLEAGPVLIVPFFESEPGTTVMVEVRADDILLARAPITGLSARNQLAGTVERVALHGSEAEVLVRTGGVTWIASLVAPAVEQFALVPGSTVHMIIKARSCHVSDPRRDSSEV